MWAGRCAAIGVVAESVNVESTLSIGIVVLDVPSNGSLGVFVGLLQSYGACDLGITTEDGDCKEGSAVLF
jgi:hypothetical protein